MAIIDCPERQNPVSDKAIEFFKKFLGPWVEQLKRSG